MPVMSKTFDDNKYHALCLTSMLVSSHSDLWDGRPRGNKPVI
jgi:hypothetical protein